MGRCNRETKKVNKLCAKSAKVCKLDVKYLNVRSECKQGINFDMTKNVDRLVHDLVTPKVVDDVVVQQPVAPGAWSISGAGQDEHVVVDGVLDYSTQVPFTENSIIRLASNTKFLGTTGYLKLIDQGYITGFEPLSQYIPEFENTEVLQKFVPTASVDLDNVITAADGSNVLNINEVAHGRNTGDVIGIQNSADVQGIPAAEINQVHIITVVDADNYTITVITLATGTSPAGEGGLIKVLNLAPGVKSTIWLNVVYYYTTIPLDKPILLYHVVTHTLGYCYGVANLALALGFAEDPELQNIQAGLYTENQIPIGFPDPSFPLSSQTIKDWVAALAGIPLLFQPGDKWSYGVQLSILGAVIEKVDEIRGLNRDLETYMKEEVLTPLDMNDTGFFIQNDAVDRADKLARIQTLYLAGTTIPTAAIPPLAYTNDWFYGETQPKTLPFIDASMYSTPRDYNKFMKMILNGGKNKYGTVILSPAMICYLSENHSLNYSIYNLVGSSTNAPIKYNRWGMGVSVSSGNTGDVPLSGCTTRAVGWYGFFGTRYQIDFGNNATVNVGFNALGSPPGQPNPLFEEKAVAANYATFKCIKPNNENGTSNNVQVLNERQ